MVIPEAFSVRSHDLERYAWSGLQRYHNVAFTSETVRRVHSVPECWMPDVRKQAAQLRYCLIQARKYFLAAKAVTLATKPTSLYYAIMSLALAEILLKQDGMSSLDKAREENRHHGLVLKYASGRAADLAVAARGLRAVPLELGGGRRAGTFNLWHRSCREMPIVGEIETRMPTGNSVGGSWSSCFRRRYRARAGARRGIGAAGRSLRTPWNGYTSHIERPRRTC
jgi:YaaC-like protein